jgi:hypothetical protein
VLLVPVYEGRVAYPLLSADTGADTATGAVADTSEPPPD